MSSCVITLASSLCAAADSLLAPVLAEAAYVVPPLAQGGGQTYGLSWAIVLLCVILGLIVTLRPSRRTSEIKKPKEY